MKASKIQQNDASSSHSSKPFISKNGEGSFFSQSHGAEKPFFSPSTIQPKLTIGQPNDKYEHEADAKAKEVIQKTENPSSIVPIQRKCEECEEDEKQQGKEEDTGEMEVRRKSVSASDDTSHIQLSTSSPPQIQKQTSSAPQSNSTSLNDEYISLICEVIDDIQRGVIEGRTWNFEREFLLQGEEDLNAQPDNLSTQRQSALRQLIESLHRLIDSIESGTVVPSGTASRLNLRRLWATQNPSLMVLNREWANPVPTSELAPDQLREPNGELKRWYYSLSWYISISPGSPERMLRPANINAWWEVSCQGQNPSEEESDSSSDASIDPILSSEIGDVDIYLTGVNDDRWDWEARGADHSPALGRIYNWHQDESRRVYILIEGQQTYLLNNGHLSTTLPQDGEADQGSDWRTNN